MTRKVANVEYDKANELINLLIEIVRDGSNENEKDENLDEQSKFVAVCRRC